ncbi:MAG TPA: response regulator transcription factor [Longimicrobiaceae bacterium]
MRILIVEDNPRILGFLKKGLSEEGYIVETATDGDEGFERARTERFDAAVVDVMLPGRSGIDLVRGLRAEGSALPILLLTALGRPEEKVHGLDAGADDYLTKPFDFSELSARLRALLRRASGAPAPTLRVGELELDPARRQVTLQGEPVQLTPKEYSLLEYLLRNPNRPLSRSMIMEHVWGIRFDPGTNVVDVFINSLRNKLDPEHELIQTVRGVGYMLSSPEEE